MELYGKALIYVVCLLVGLHIIQTLLYRNNKEGFIDKNIKTTLVDSIKPNEGDSSTVVTLKGSGFDNVSKIYFKLGSAYSQTIILNNRNDTQIDLLPPPISELGKNILDIRENIKENKRGIEVEVVFILGEKENNSNYTDLALKLDEKNVVKVKELYFYYIDRIPYQNNCTIPPEPEAVAEPAETNNTTEGVSGDNEIDYPEDTDLEFLNKTLEEKQNKINLLYSEVEKNLNKYNNIKAPAISQLESHQVLESLDEMKKQFNRERYHIHNYLNQEYQMGLDL